MLKRLVLVGAFVCLCIAAPAKNKYLRPGPVHLDREGEKWAEKTLSRMSLEEKVGQMLMVRARAEFLNVRNPEFQRLREAVGKYHLGGFGLTVSMQSGLPVKGEPYEAAALINALQRSSELPLIFAADFERGVSMRLNGATEFPQAMAFGAAGDLDYVEQFARITAQESRAIGVEWNWFPVADVNSNPANPIINTRAFGGDPQQVGELVAAYVRGARSAGMLSTAKHFPGHGDTSADSHLDVARVEGDRRRLQTVELRPFQAAIAAGVDAILVAHLSVPALDPDPGHVATNSPSIVDGLLRKELGFRGLVVSDALDMAGMMHLYEATNGSPSARAAVDVVKAGNDIVLLPPDLDAAYRGLLQAVRSGELSERRIDASVLRILQAKAAVGLHRARLVDLESLPELIGNPENLAKAQQIADAAVTLVRDENRFLPLTATARGTASSVTAYTRVVETKTPLAVVVFTEDLRSETGRVFERQLRTRIPGANIVFVDANTAAFSSQAVLAMVSQAEKIVAAVFSGPVSGRKVAVGGELQNTIALEENQVALLRAILTHAADRTAVVALGNPYLPESFPGMRTYLCTFSNAPVSETSAIKALFGEIVIRGRSPVDIPGMAPRGAGLDRAARRRGHLPWQGVRNDKHGETGR
jgi:beta-N-acetylhexosaminidase